MSQMRTAQGAPAKTKHAGALRAAAEYEGLMDVGGVEMYRMPHYDRLDPFMMTISSPADHWMYLSSFGGLTAGRGDADHAIFPYETEDRLHHLQGITGPITLIRAAADGASPVLWEPFNHRQFSSSISRNLYKTVLCDRVIFEEIHHDLELTFRYQWACSPRFGFVRTATLMNQRPARGIKIEILDGLLNILPACVSLALQQGSSCLVDAYKRAEVDKASGLAVYSLSSLITDRPEPGECLKGNTVFSRGLPDCRINLSEQSVQAFRQEKSVAGEDQRFGQRGAFLLQADFELGAGLQVQWDIAADVEQDHARIADLRGMLMREQDLRERIASDVQSARASLLKQTAVADSQQVSGDVAASAHHAANVLFNNFRGGVPADQYHIDSVDFARFLHNHNRSAAVRCADFVQDLPAKLPVMELVEKADTDGDPDLRRIAREYLPLVLSRRHGDPSRPWNRFSIRGENADGSAAIHYEGNWRDIFQNWEALAFSFPELIENFIAKFVNASTVDGYNPYRISDEGIDWEKLDPANPWSNIGYWGDHQIVYLLKFLESAAKFQPRLLPRLLGESIFSFANLPYRIKPYAELMEHPRQSIRFDQQLDEHIARRVAEMGADGKLLAENAGRVQYANLLEKLLIPLLSKLANLVLAGGIWMNTQRPEWNDANNALAGYGLSMVTLCYLRRYVQFLLDLLKPLAEGSAQISREVLDWLNETGAALLKHSDLLRQAAPDGMGRRRLLDDLGHAFDQYRQRVYAHGFSGKASCPITEILPMLRLALSYLDNSIDASRRDDGLYHSYNVLHVAEDGPAQVEHLQLMLEGQVAALNSGKIEADQAIEILEALFASPLYDAERNSFLLYPAEAINPFISRNRINALQVNSNPLLAARAKAQDRSIIIADGRGDFHFHPAFATAGDLERALERCVKEDRTLAGFSSSIRGVLDLYENLFHHRHFTGRSGAMHAYEGIGSIYWHMIGKLLLAAQECFWRAVDTEQPAAQIHRLGELYYRVREGLGFNKNPGDYGAFPTDPHSHTPASGGARQPGMTGQVKEEILRRFGELGIRIKDGQIYFWPQLLRRGEFLIAPVEFQGHRLEIGSLGFNYCGVPIIYRLSERGPRILISGQAVIENEGNWLTPEQSQSFFRRDGKIHAVQVDISPSQIQFE